MPTQVMLDSSDQIEKKLGPKRVILKAINKKPTENTRLENRNDFCTALFSFVPWRKVTMPHAGNHVKNTRYWNKEKDSNRAISPIDQRRAIQIVKKNRPKARETNPA